MTSARAVFVTGGAGFVGRRLLATLDAAGIPVVALDRSGRVAARPGVTVIRGDLSQPERYREALRGCRAVLHLAAATGNAAAAEHERVNVDGTAALVGACREAGVDRFLFVSSIAVTFADLRGYPYGLAKARAEQLVAASGLQYAILRPTMILGEGAPILGSLARLALLPVVLVPGSGRVRVQPVGVTDVARALHAVLELDRFTNNVYEIGGADTVTMEELLQRVRASRTGRPGRVVRLPLPFLQIPLRMAEAAGLGRLLPVTAGQLSSFRYDGVAEPNPLQTAITPGLAGVDDLLAESAARDEGGAAGPTGPTGSSGAGPVNAAEADRESRVFTRHLLGCEPDAAAQAAYRAALAAMPALAPAGAFDEALLSFARRGVVGVRLADGHAALFARASALRKRLVVMLAILETRAPFFEAIDRPLGGSPAAAVPRVAGRLALALAGLAIGTLLFLPLRLFLPARKGSA